MFIFILTSHPKLLLRPRQKLLIGRQWAEFTPVVVAILHRPVFEGGLGGVSAISAIVGARWIFGAGTIDRRARDVRRVVFIVLEG